MKCPQEISPIAGPGSDFMRSEEPSAPAGAAQPGARQRRRRRQRRLDCRRVRRASAMAVSLPMKISGILPLEVR